MPLAVGSMGSLVRLAIVTCNLCNLCNHRADGCCRTPRWHWPLSDLFQTRTTTSDAPRASWWRTATPASRPLTAPSPVGSTRPTKPGYISFRLGSTHLAAGSSSTPTPPPTPPPASLLGMHTGRGAAPPRPTGRSLVAFTLRSRTGFTSRRMGRPTVRGGTGSTVPLGPSLRTRTRGPRLSGTALSGPILAILTDLTWLCVGIRRRAVLPCPARA